MFAYIFPIVCGAAIGAVLRWLFGLVLVSSAPFPIGTLAANWLGDRPAGLYSMADVLGFTS